MVRSPLDLVTGPAAPRLGWSRHRRRWPHSAAMGCERADRPAHSLDASLLAGRGGHLSGEVVFLLLDAFAESEAHELRNLDGRSRRLLDRLQYLLDGGFAVA